MDTDGIKHVLGHRGVQSAGGAKFWLGVFTELTNRGVRDVLICCDGLQGLPEAMETVWPTTVVQTCVVHYADLRTVPMWSLIPLQCKGSGLVRCRHNPVS